MDMSTYNIDYDAHYFIPLAEVDVELPYFGIIAFNPKRRILIECTISEGMYGKVAAIPLGYEDGVHKYVPEKYYDSDFDALIREGVITKKTSETQHVELIEEWEPLTNNTHIVHSSYAIVE